MVTRLAPVVTAAKVWVGENCSLGVATVTDGAGAVCSITSEGATSGAGVALVSADAGATYSITGAGAVELVLQR